MFKSSSLKKKNAAPLRSFKVSVSTLPEVASNPNKPVVYFKQAAYCGLCYQEYTLIIDVYKANNQILLDLIFILIPFWSYSTYFLNN